MARKAFAVLVLALGLVPPAKAHAVLVDAKPAQNGTVTGPDVAIQLRFNARIDSARSRLQIMLPDHTIRVLTLEHQASPATLNSHISGLAHGTYRLQWQVLASDGHISRGEVPFQVK
jgi:methionine-rich copper-binding protein CopC